MKRKSIIALLLAMAMCLAMLTGCSDPAEDSTSTESGDTTQSESEESTDAAESAGTTEAEETTESTDAESAEALKVAWICDGVLTDGGWNADGYASMQELAEEYNLDVSYQENVADTSVADVLREYASEGYQLIISNEQYHCETMAEVAAEYPDITFACVNGYVSADNMIAITGDMWQHIYLAGVMSGMVTTSNKLGLITYSTDSDSALTMLAAYQAGAASVNADAEVIHVATGSFSDLAVGKEMATSLIDQGCDVILCNSGDCNETVMQTCIDSQVYTISAIVDRNHMSDEYVLGSAMLPPSGILPMILKEYMEGSTGSSEVQVMGLAEGVEEFRVNPDIEDKLDQSVLDALDAAAAGIEDGSITVELP